MASGYRKVDEADHINQYEIRKLYDNVCIDIGHYGRSAGGYGEIELEDQAIEHCLDQIM